MEFEWRCPECPYYVHKPSKQALGLARSNHLRKHTRSYLRTVEEGKIG